MAESNKTVKGEQPKGNQKDPKKETTDPYMNKTPIVGKARARKPAASGTKAVSKASTSSASRSRSNSSGSSAQKGSKTSAKASGIQNDSASGKADDDTNKKVMVSGLTDEVVPLESALNQQSVPMGEEIPSVVERDEYVQSVADLLKEESEDIQQQDQDDQDSKKGKKQDKREKKVRKLVKKAEKAEKKVDKLMGKYKKAQKEDVKLKKLHNIKDLLLKAYATLRKRHRKLRGGSK